MNTDLIQRIEEHFGVKIDEPIAFDGKTFHRFDVDKKGDKALWVIAFEDGNVQAGNWKTGESAFFYAKTEAEENILQQKSIVERTRKELETFRLSSLKKAKELYESLPPASADQEYLVRKRIKAVDGVRQEGKSLVIPGFDPKGDLQTIQHILPNGEKRFFIGCTTAGAYFVIGEVSNQMYLVEGYATGYSVYEATGAGVVVAFNAGNLESASKAFLSTHPDVSLIVVADNDFPRNGEKKGVGELKAEKTGLPYVLIPKQGMDANDYLLAGNDLKMLLQSSAVSVKNPLGLVFDYDLSKDLTELGWLIDGWIPRNSIIMIYGSPGCSKSTLSVDLAMSYACKLEEWNKHSIDHQGGVVVYLSGEGYPGLIKRKMVWEQVHDVSSIGSIAFSKRVSKINTPEGYEETAKALKALDKPIDLILIDTFRRAFEGDENDSGATESFFSALQRLSDEFKGASIIIIHHAGKNPKGGPRGSSNHAASVDVLISVERDRTKNLIKVTQEKQKDAEELEPEYFKMESATLIDIRDSKGRELSAPYISGLNKNEVSDANIISPIKKADAFTLFKKMWKGTKRKVEGEVGEYPFISIAEFLDYYVSKKGISKKSASNYLRAERCPFAELLKNGKMKWEDEGFYLTDKDLIKNLENNTTETEEEDEPDTVF